MSLFVDPGLPHKDQGSHMTKTYLLMVLLTSILTGEAASTPIAFVVCSVMGSTGIYMLVVPIPGVKPPLARIAIM